MRNYDFDAPINRRNTKSYKWDLYPDKLPLWVADTDFIVPEPVTKRLQARLDHGIFGYLLTGNEIYDAIAGWFDRDLHTANVTKEMIKLVPTGIVPALSVASNIGCGSSITNIPNYVNLLGAPGMAGNQMIEVMMHKEVKDGYDYYSIDFDALESALQEDTKVFYLCNPHNPVGRVYSFDELKAISAFAKKHELIVVSDEAHCEVVYEGKHIPFFTVDDYARNHSICLYSNGKLYNVPDLICAFAVIPNASLMQEFTRLGYGFGEEHILNIEAGVATYRDCGAYKRALMEYLKDNRDYLETEMRRRFPKASFVHLEATFLFWADFRAYGVDQRFFFDEAQVFLTDGAEFGEAGYVRINFGTRRAVLTEALDRMEMALKKRL